MVGRVAAVVRELLTLYLQRGEQTLAYRMVLPTLRVGPWKSPPRY